MRPIVNNTTLQSTLQRKVALTVSSSLFVISSINFIIMVFNKKLPVGQLVFNYIFYLPLILAILFLISFYLKHVVSRIIQVFAFGCVGILMTIVNEPGALNGPVFFIYGVILGFQYGFFRKWLKAKLIISLGLFGLITILAANFKQDFGFPFGVPTAIMTVALIYLFWVVFADEIKQLVRETHALQEEIDRERAFVELGRNLLGVVHNLKSRLMALSGFMELVEEEGDKKMVEYASMQRKAYHQIVEMVENLMFVATSYQNVNPQPVSLNKIVKGIIEIFNANLDFKQTVIVKVELDSGNDTIMAAPQELLRLLENLVNNSYESMTTANQNEIKILSAQEDDRLKLSLSDNGRGIPFCDQCRHHNCLNCREFRLGRTSKKGGHGIGMIEVLAYVKSLKGNIRVDSKIDVGTTVTIWFPSIPKPITIEG
ncbi:MAG: HAMP domain-containing sensor histidine kinase [Spirochaetota bacterium]